MAVDTPARIAILGAGPIGLEAALYARFLGYDVDLYERGRVADNIRRWGHVRMFSPFGMNRSSLGLAALKAQDDNYQPPADDALLTGREYVEHYLLPLAESDLLADSLHEQTEVLAVGRPGPLKHELVGSDERIDYDFRLLLSTADGESTAACDVVIDTTGVYGHPNWLGQGGIPAVGERALRSRIEYGLPDIAAEARADYAGKHVAVIGGGLSAATNVAALADLAAAERGTRVTWIARQTATGGQGGPVVEILNDPLHERAALARHANQLASGGSPAIQYHGGVTVDAIVHDAATGQFTLRLSGGEISEIVADRVIANVGYRSDRRIYAELQVDECYATGGLRKLAATLANAPTDDLSEQPACGPEALIIPEPDFYILGAKSYGRKSRFLISEGLEQIRGLFSIIGDRPDLNLYKTVSVLPG